MKHTLILELKLFDLFPPQCPNLYYATSVVHSYFVQIGDAEFAAV